MKLSSRSSAVVVGVIMLLAVLMVGCATDSAAPELPDEASDTVSRIGPDVTAISAGSNLAQACLTQDSEFSEGPCYAGCGILSGVCALDATVDPPVARCLASDSSGAEIELATEEAGRSQEAATYRKLHPCTVPACSPDGTLSVKDECGGSPGWVVSGTCSCERELAELPIGGEITRAVLDRVRDELVLFVIRDGKKFDVVRHFLDCASESLDKCLQILPEKFFAGDEKSALEVDSIPGKDPSKSAHYLAAWVNLSSDGANPQPAAVMTAVEVKASKDFPPEPAGSPSKVTLVPGDAAVVRVVPAALSEERAFLTVETAPNESGGLAGVEALLLSMDLTNPQWYSVLDSIELGQGMRLEDVVGIDVFEVILMVEEVEADVAEVGWGPLYAELLTSEADQIQERSEKTSLGIDCQVGSAHALFSPDQDALFVVCTDPEGFVAARRLRIDFELGDFVPEIKAPAKTYGRGLVTGLTMAENSEDSVLVVPFEAVTAKGVSEVRLTAFSSDLQLRVSDSTFVPANPWGHFSPDVRAAVTDDGQRLLVTYVVRGMKGPVDMGSLMRLFRGVTSLELH